MGKLLLILVFVGALADGLSSKEPPLLIDAASAPLDPAN